MKITVFAKTNKVGSTSENEIDIDDDDLKGMSNEEKEEHINKIALEYILESVIEWGWDESEN